MPKSKILVIGDTCKDVFIYCECERLCPESPVPVLDIKNTVTNAGMAGNVARNIESLGGTVSLITNSNANLITKTRYVDIKTNHMFIRIDKSLPTERIQDIKKLKLGNYDAVVISDYNKGFLSADDISYISHNHPLTFLDTKKFLSIWAEDITFIKINRKEYTASEQYLNDKLKRNIIQTLGNDGCVYRDRRYSVKDVEIKNLSGAGDSFLAALAIKYVETKNISKSLKYANEIASIVVQKAGVSTITS